ncbi:CAMK/CAMKL/KIN1 protein kinase [Venturia nashicola]|uniref:non-specific serine/threonine protein kinase n=1 Tax=Venturia nashicola TaxID=86259 RepID=A0A4Z1P976_9PEZI|nr:CAMK/CAMKL/KIN1 protein kinase [Venturia nashicola]
MSSAASAVPVVRSSSHRTPPGENSQRPHRSQSTRVGSSGHRSTGSGQSAGLSNVAQRDLEQSNLAQPSPAGRRSMSHDRERDRTQQYPTRTDSMRAGTHRTTSSRGTNSERYASIDGTAQPPPPPSNGAPSDPTQARPQPSQGRRRTTIDTQTGKWGLGKTIGAGSMGKVKLAKNLESGEQVAIKIVPRQSTDEHRSQADRERADHSKEVRTAREAAIVSLVNHPYICGMKDVVRTQHHWYMLFEYVNGGQMLDYIISHGRLKEKQARKFARQIASALDYCHRNSIVHRDLKIENILISKTGDIKIIDFGLSNLFAPHSHLKTFCGSLYFAAPELLQAKQYTGPEVDIWSFGIVLYVLVCGKVPFDDQSMPQLHAKIKKGFVEYPPWLSAECKNLISRMLVTDPKQRATLTEIMNHTWMTKGSLGSPENYLPLREPLALPLDPEVIHKMHGFDFGTPEYISNQLTKLIQSDDYSRVVRNAQRRHPTHNAEAERKRGVFDFYKRRNSTTSRDTLTNSSNEAVQLGDDPINAYSPLISIYYLVREKMDRERQDANPGALAMPTSPGEKPLKMPDLPAPAAAYTNSNAYEMAGEAPTGGRTRPRARTHGEDEVTDELKRLKMQQGAGVDGAHSPALLSPADQIPVRKESAAAGLLRRFSTRKRRDPPSEREHVSHPPVVNVQSPSDGSSPNPPPRKSFSIRRTRPGETSEGPPSSASLHLSGSQRHHPELLTPPSATGEGFPKRFMSLRRSSSVDRRRLAKRGASESHAPPEPPPTSGSDGSSYNNGKQPVPADGASDDNRPVRGTASRAKSLGHARRESIQARRLRREQAKEENVPEETDAEVAEARADRSEETMRPVFLKGLFSVSTTSSKPLPVIRADIIRVLRQLGVEYTEMKNGFSCKQTPSIDLSRHNDASPHSPHLTPSAGHRRKISFGGIMGGSSNNDKDRDEFRDNFRSSPQTPRTPATHRSPRLGDDHTPEDSDESLEERRRYRKNGRASNPGETSTHVRDDTGSNMILRFEILLVKVPLLSLHGIQFKKVDGNMMHYKNMAQAILKALKL